LRVPIGFVLRAHGIKGALRVRGGDSILSLAQVYLDGHPVKVLRATRDKQEFLVELEGVSDRDAAERLKGAELSADRDQLPPPGEDEVYLADLVGCRVVDAAGADLGEVVSVESNTAQELLVIRAPSGERTWRLPFVAELLVSVDLAARRIVCDPPEGLLDL
jgi:16S rRNA processing protein RimM